MGLSPGHTALLVSRESSDEAASQVSLTPCTRGFQTWLHLRIMWVVYENTAAQAPTQTKWIRISGLGVQASIMCVCVGSEAPWPLTYAAASTEKPVPHRVNPPVCLSSQKYMCVLHFRQGRDPQFLAVMHWQEFVKSHQCISHSNTGLQFESFIVPAVSFIFDSPQCSACSKRSMKISGVDQ